jgi:hypothetical protein
MYMTTGSQAIGTPISLVAQPGVVEEPRAQVEQWRSEVEQLCRRIHDPSQDFVGVGAQLCRLEKQIDGAISQYSPERAQNLGLLTVQTQIREAVAFMGTEPTCSLAKEQEKWVAVGFDRSLLTSDPEAVHFAVSSRLIYTISMFAKSATYLEGEVMTIKAIDGKAYFKVEGGWKPYAAFKDRIRYSEELYKIVGWNFIHPLGFVPYDWAEYERIYPIAKLNERGIRAAQTHAKKFWQGHPEVDPGAEKPCVLQVIITGREWEGLPKAWWANNLREHFPKHTSLRLITPEGDLYSFGAKMGLQDGAFLCSATHQLGTGLATVPVPDYEEPRRPDDRTMIAVPLSTERADRVLAFASEANKGISFNFIRQNCVRFADIVMRLAGVKMTSRLSIGQFLADSLPRVSDIPYVGKGLAGVASSVCSVASRVFHFIGSAASVLTPYPLKHVWNIVAGAVDKVVSRITAFIVNGTLLTFFGADTTVVPETQPQVSEVEHFRQFLSWKDLWTPNAFEFYFSTQLERWMRGQPNVLVFHKPEHGFCCLNEEVLQCRRL